MTCETAVKVGRAAGYIFQQEARRHTVLIGKDTRISGYMLENALTSGLCSMGVNVLLTGPIPTPGVSYIMRSLRCDAAVMISASHNEFQYNGIKFFGRDGYKIPDEIEDEVARLVGSGEIDNMRPTADEIGTAKRIDDAVGRYIEFAKATFPKGMRLDGLRIVVDAANGASYKVGPYSLMELGAEVIAIHNTPNGRNINDKCGSVHPEDMRATVIRERADLGIAFDGDGDRLIMSDGDGRMLDGNAILAVLAIDMIERALLPHNTLATNIMANAGLVRALEPCGGQVAWTKVGDRYVTETMRERGLTLGGEPSGHIVMLEHNATGDALIASLQILATIIRRDQPLSALAAAYQPYPEAHASVPLNGKECPTEEAIETVRAQAEEELLGTGRVVIRPSGTEPVIRILVQHDKQKVAEGMVKQLVKRVGAL
jgi:phosphoglucosamine mutase